MTSKTWLSTNYFLQFLVTGTFLPFWMVYLTSVKNLSVLEASSIFSMLYIARVISGIFLSPYLIKKYNIDITLKLSVGIGLILAVSYGFTNEKNSTWINYIFIRYDLLHGESPSRRTSVIIFT